MRSILAGAFTVLILSLAAAAARASAPAAEVFGALPESDNVVLSPDGNTLAWSQTKADNTMVLVFDIASHKIKHTQIIDHTLKLRDLYWSDDETLLITVSISQDVTSRTRHRERYEYWRILALDLNTGQFHPLLSGDDAFAYVTGMSVLALRTAKPKTIIVSTWDWSAAASGRSLGTRLANERRDSGWVLSLFEVDTRSGKGTLLEQGSPYTLNWVVDKDGKAVARGEWNPGEKNYRILVKRGAGWPELLHHSGADIPLSLEGLTADGTAIVARGSLDQSSAKLLAIPLDGTAPHVMLEEANSEVTGVFIDRFTRTPLGARMGGSQPTVRWFDPAAKAHFESVQQAFPDRHITLYSESQDKQRVIAYVDDAATAPVYYLVDFKAHKADIVGEAYPAIGRAALGTLKITSFKARDGTQIPAYLTLPPGSDGKKLPLIVLPHGGPEARDLPNFDWWSQFLATRGYAVLQPQFRGSWGFGEAYRLAGRRQWGGLMQDDVTDGVQALIADGTADPNRVCIVGASYGGYAALAGATFTPQLYRCAASINGVSDLADMLQWEENRSGSQSNSVAYWNESIGPRLDPKVMENSPVHAADRVTGPVLIMYSADDTVVAPSQSEVMARALKDAGKNVTLVKLDGDDHWLSHGATRVRMLQELEKFLGAQLHP